MTEHGGFYSDPVWSPDGERIVALRAASDDRLYREWDFGAPLDVIWLPADGGEARIVLPSRGFRSPHFGPETDRIYLYSSDGPFTRSGKSALMSVRFDGTDRRYHLGVKGPGIYFAEGDVPAEDIRLSPDGRHALVVHANQLYVLRLLNRHLANLQTTVSRPSVPLARLTDVGVDAAAWGDNGASIHWSVGNRIYSRPLDSVDFRSDTDEDDGEEEAQTETDEEQPVEDEEPEAPGDGAEATDPDTPDEEEDEPTRAKTTGTTPRQRKTPPRRPRSPKSTRT